jgi:hypothetical protein
MARMKATKDGLVPFTAEEEAQADAMQADMEANADLYRRQAMTVTNKQLRLALNEAGVYGDIDAAMAKSTKTTELEIHWNYSTTINRLDPWVVEVTAAMQLNDEAVDEIFDKAAMQ